MLVSFALIRANAQIDSVKSKINDIKLDESYVYGEGTDDDKNIAYDNALQEITEIINEQRLMSGKCPIAQNDIVGRLSQYGYNRGEAQYIFLYVWLSEAMAIQPRESAELSVNIPVRDESPIPIDAEEKPIVLTAHSDEKNAISNKDYLAPFVATQTAINSPSQDFLSYLMEFTQITDLIKSLERFRDEGKISAVNTPKSLMEIPSDAFVVVYDREYTVKAIMSPSKDGQRTNYKTNLPDAIQNYHGCGVLWYK